MERAGAHGLDVTLEPVTSDNWRAVEAVRPLPEQERFVAPISHYLCLMLYEHVWTCLAVCRGDQVVGHVMRGYDPDEDAGWIGGLVIDADHQRRGIGGRVVELLLEAFTRDGHGQASLSYEPDNTVARRMYAQAGFVETGELLEEEVIARRPLPA